MYNNYNRLIDEKLGMLIPSLIKNEIELLEESIDVESYHIKKAPKINGNFGFLKLRYMRNVREIKKLCVEYINTYIDGALNLADKMDDDVELIDVQNSLARELKFKKEGISTNDDLISSTTKEGVLFLTGDKALKDKLENLIQKIKIRSKKNKLLSEWSELMMLQSKILANSIIFEATNELIKDPDTKKKRVKQKEKFDDDYKQLYNQIQEESKKTQDALNKIYELSGKLEKFLEDNKIDKKEIDDNISNVDVNKDNEPPVIESNDDSNYVEINTKGEINNSRNEFNKKTNIDVTEDKLNEFVEIVSDYEEENNEEFTNNELQFIYATMIFFDHWKNNKSLPAPIDYYVSVFNNDDCEKLLNDIIDFDNYKKYIFKKDFLYKKCKELLKHIIDKYKLNGDYDTLMKALSGECKTIIDITDDKSINESKKHIKKSAEFIFEKNSNYSKSFNDVYSIVVDYLDNCKNKTLCFENNSNELNVNYISLKNNKLHFYIKPFYENKLIEVSLNDSNIFDILTENVIPLILNDF